MTIERICDNCTHFVAVHEVGCGDAECDGTCGISGELVSIFDSCDGHELEVFWYDE